MNKAKILGIIEVVGLTLVVLAVALWALPQEGTRSFAAVGLAVAASSDYAVPSAASDNS